MSDPNREGCWMQLRVISAGAGIVAGCVSCPLFGFLYQNTDAAVWAGLSVIIVSMVFQLHLLYRYLILILENFNQNMLKMSDCLNFKRCNPCINNK